MNLHTDFEEMEVSLTEIGVKFRNLGSSMSSSSDQFFKKLFLRSRSE